jgi:malonate transporter and related proteins
MMTHPILMALAPVFFVLLLGYAAGRFQIVDNHRVDGLNTLVMGFALPASLFAATAWASRHEMLEQGPLFLAFGFTMLLIYFVSYWAARSFSSVSRSDASLQALTIGYPNVAGVGLPIASAVLGPSGTVQVAVAVACGAVLVSPLTLVVVELSAAKTHGASGRRSIQILSAVWRAVTKPVVLAPALGIVLSLSGVKLDLVTHACLSLIGNAAAGIALFLTGLTLSAHSFRLNWTVVRATAVSDIIRPLLAAAFVYVVSIPSEVAKSAILFAAVPSGFFGILVAVNYRLDSSTIGSMVTASTVFSIASMAIVITSLFPS